MLKEPSAIHEYSFPIRRCWSVLARAQRKRSAPEESSYEPKSARSPRNGERTDILPSALSRLPSACGYVQGRFKCDISSKPAAGGKLRLRLCIFRCYHGKISTRSMSMSPSTLLLLSLLRHYHILSNSSFFHVEKSLIVITLLVPDHHAHASHSLFEGRIAWWYSTNLASSTHATLSFIRLLRCLLFFSFLTNYTAIMTLVIPSTFPLQSHKAPKP